MGNTMDVSQGMISTIVTAIKRSRPLDWIVDEPPAKKPRISIFDEDGAKAVKIPETYHVTVNVS
jgi:hypothetical protein